MKGNICCSCFSSIFENGLPGYIRTVEEHQDCTICNWRNAGWFYARKDELEIAKKIYEENKVKN